MPSIAQNFLPLDAMPDQADLPQPSYNDGADWTAFQGPLIVALPGAGCSPHVFDQVHTPGWRLRPLDWAQPPHSSNSCHPLQVAIRVAQLLRPRLARGEPTVVLGYSVGGVMAMLVAMQPGISLSGLVVGNTGAHSRNHGDPLFAQRVRQRWDAATQQDFLRACFHRPPSPALWAQLCDYLSALPMEAFLQTVQGLRSIDISDQLQQIRCPALVVHGQWDLRRSLSDAQALAQGMAQADLQLLPGGHTPMVDCPAQYNRALNTFLERLLPPQQRQRCHDRLGASACP